MAKNRYAEIMEAIFLQRYREGARQIPFSRSDIVEAAREAGIVAPKNLGDIVYSFRYRTPRPE